eukprot:2454445-Alexandrium_andersonii.AAC.1
MEEFKKLKSLHEQAVAVGEDDFAAKIKGRIDSLKIRSKADKQLPSTRRLYSQSVQYAGVCADK